MQAVGGAFLTNKACHLLRGSRSERRLLVDRWRVLRKGAYFSIEGGWNFFGAIRQLDLLIVVPVPARGETATFRSSRGIARKRELHRLMVRKGTFPFRSCIPWADMNGLTVRRQRNCEKSRGSSSGSRALRYGWWVRSSFDLAYTTGRI